MLRAMSCALLLTTLAVLPTRQIAAADQPIVEVSKCWVKFIELGPVSSQRPGVLAKVLPKEGDVVRRDQLLAKIWDEVAVAQHEIAKKEASSDVDVRYSRKATQVARKELEMANDANRRREGAVSNLEIERLRLALEKADLQTEKAEQDSALAAMKATEKEVELKTYHILAPFDGVVTRVHKLNGQAVQQGDPIFEVANPAVLKVEGYVSPDVARRIRPGQAVRVRMTPDENDDRDFPKSDAGSGTGVRAGDAKPRPIVQANEDYAPGVIQFVDVSVDPVIRKVRVWARVDNREGKLIAGLYSQMEILPGGSPVKAADAASNSLFE